MSVWASQGARREDNNGDVINNVTEIYFDVVTDVNGQFIVNIEPFNLVEVLEVVAQIVGQTLSTADNIVDKLTATIIEITNRQIKGVVTKPNEIDTSVSVGARPPVQRGGQGNNVKVKVTGRR
jgi:hypothetical protein